jgi:hypothetical protein
MLLHMYTAYNHLYVRNCFNVTSGRKMCSKKTPIIKKVHPLHFLSQEEQRKKEKKNKSLYIEQIYGHGSQRGSMTGVTVLAGCRQ